MGLEQILGGFAKGFGQSRMWKMEQERQKEKDALTKTYTQSMIAAQKTKLEEAKLKQSLITALMGGQSPGASPTASASKPIQFDQSGGTDFGSAGVTTPTKFGKSFQSEPTGLPDMMAKMQTNPGMAAALKELTGIDFIGAGNMGIRQKDFERRGNEMKTVTVPQGDGGSSVLEVPKFGSATGPGTKTLGTAPPPTDFEEMESGGITYRRVVNKATKAPMDGEGGRWQPISGKKGLPSEAAGKLGMVESGLSDMGLAKGILLGKNGEVNEDTYKRLAEMSVPGGGMPWSKGREARSFMLNAMEGKIRIESGAAVPDQEMARLAERFMPSMLDSKALIKSKLDRLESYLAGQVEKLDPNKNYSASTLIITGEGGEKLAWTPGKADIKKQSLPAAAREKLKEGVNTTFGNGQVWTLKNGEPVKVE